MAKIPEELKSFMKYKKGLPTSVLDPEFNEIMRDFKKLFGL